MSLLYPLCLFAIVTLFTPGPNNVMLASSGMNFGFRRTLPHLLGVCLGFPILVLLVGWGLAGLFVRWQPLHHILKIAGALYLAYLAYRIATAPTSIKDADSRARPLSIWQAAAFQWVNPKGWVMAVTAATSYTTLSGDNFREVALIGAVFLLFGFPSAALWTSFGMVIRRSLSDPRHVRALNLVMAIALVASILPMIAE
jgi:threonine/homoserine/homoserine lactone efflux protein